MIFTEIMIRLTPATIKILIQRWVRLASIGSRIWLDQKSDKIADR